MCVIMKDKDSGLACISGVWMGGLTICGVWYIAKVGRGFMNMQFPVLYLLCFEPSLHCDLVWGHTSWWRIRHLSLEALSVIKSASLNGIFACKSAESQEGMTCLLFCYIIVCLVSSFLVFLLGPCAPGPPEISDRPSQQTTQW